MGMYTELLIKCMVRENLAPEVQGILDYLFLDKEKPKMLPNHDFFLASNWDLIGRCNSYYHIPMTINYYKDRYLFSRSDIKNYGNEIGLFLGWFNPYIDTEEKCIGWRWYEEDIFPTLIYKK